MVNKSLARKFKLKGNRNKTSEGAKDFISLLTRLNKIITNSGKNSVDDLSQSNFRIKRS